MADGAEHFFKPGDLRLMIAASLTEKGRHGYEIIKLLSCKIGGHYSPSSGVVYPTLSLLVKNGLAMVEEEPGGRRIYSLSAAGRSFLEANRARIDELSAKISVSGEIQNVKMTSVSDALEGLEFGVKRRLRTEQVTADQLNSIAAALDAAAKAVKDA
jgi:DNA-binding PadR family transcriptional regulator